MKPVEFRGSNTIFARDQKPYVELPAYKGDDGMVISCWACESWRERLSILFTGKVWHFTLTFGKPLQPLKIGTENPFES